jgi:serine/threonine protein kinase
MTNEFVPDQDVGQSPIVTELTRDGHVVAQTIYEFSAGLLTSLDAAAVAQHLDQCPRCAQLCDTISVGEDPFVAKLRAAQPFSKPASLAFDNHTADFQQAVNSESIADSTDAAPSVERDPVATRFTVGTKIGPYLLLKFLGRGAFGEVWLAERESAIAKNRLAVKLPLQAVLDLSAIRKEAEAWIRAGNHPNILPMFEANVFENQVVVVSEYAADGSLREWLDRHGGHAPSVEVAVEMAMAILSGLEHLHVRGIVHRDLKPANVLMQGECPRIADFGLAWLIDPDAMASQTVGTPGYMAPEAFDGGRSVQTDLWSAGVITYQLLSGNMPFPTGNLMRLMKAILTEAPSSLPESLPSSLRQTVLRALAKDPDARFRSAADMRAALRDSLRQLEGRSVPPGGSISRGVRTVAVTGSMHADRGQTFNSVQTLLEPYCGEQTTWYCGTVGTVDACAAEYLLAQGQRVIAVGYGAEDLSGEISDLLKRHGAPFVDSQNEQVSQARNAPSRRDMFFVTKADLVILFWDGVSPGTAELLAWLRQQRKDHVIGFV